MNLELIIATNNESKIEEFGHVFTQNGYKLRTLRDIAVESDPEETGTTYEDNAIISSDITGLIANNKKFSPIN